MHSSSSLAIQSKAKRRVAGRREVTAYLPDDIVINILIRLPADDVLRCRCVCRGWKDLTSTQEFEHMHLSRQLTAPAVLFEVPRQPSGDYYFIDKWWEPRETRRKRWVFSKLAEYGFRFSQGGLVLLSQPRGPRRPQSWIILNPINYGEYVTVKFPRDKLDTWEEYEVYGVFFHPLLKEYCMLWGKLMREISAYRPILAKYKLLVMASSPYSIDIGNPLGEVAKQLGSKPILVNDHLYWKAWRDNDIIEYDIGSEEFVGIPSPVTLEYYPCSTDLTLLNIDGVVSVVNTDHISISEKKLIITIWALKDRLRKLWTSSCYNISTQGCPYDRPFKPIAFTKGELFFYSAGKVFVCNFKSNTMTSFHNLSSDGGNLFVSHVMTVASLKKRNPQIEVTETTEATSGCRIQITWEQSNRAESRKHCGY